jgi:hypothetical protein
MAVSEVAANDHDPIRSVYKGFSYHGGVDPACTHNPDDSYVRRILDPGNSSEISCGVPSPGTAENQDLWSEIGQGSHLPLISDFGFRI